MIQSINLIVVLQKNILRKYITEVLRVKGLDTYNLLSKSSEKNYVYVEREHKNDKANGVKHQ